MSKNYNADVGLQPLFLFKILGVPFFSFTTLSATGITLAFALVLWDSRLAKPHASEASEALLYSAVPALILGRAVHILYNLYYFAERPGEVLRYTDGGMTLVGLVCGGVLGAWFWCRRSGYPLALLLDRAATPLFILAALAWLGAFLHGSQYGAPADNGIALELRDTFGVISARWPTQLLAAVWSAVVGIVLLLSKTRDSQLPDAQTPSPIIVGICLVAYSIGMILLDFTRGDLSPTLAGLRITQVLYLVLLFSGLLYTARTKALI